MKGHFCKPEKLHVSRRYQCTLGASVSKNTEEEVFQDKLKAKFRNSAHPCGDCQLKKRTIEH